MTDEIASLRDELARCDRALVSLLAERMRLIGGVADAKQKAGLPSFDRDREGVHLDALSNQARQDGLPLDVIRDVFGILFAASRHEQRQHLYPKEDHLSIGVIGGTGGMGAFLAQVFASGGHQVEVTGLERSNPNVIVAARHDLVIVAVPIAATVDVIGEVAPHVRPGACLMDVTSLKRAPLDAMLAHTPASVAVVGTHPMFGPHGDDFDRQKVVLCRGRGDDAFNRIRRLYESFGAEIIEADADEHDRHMALIQVLVHAKTMVLGSVLERLRADLGRSLQFASPIYRTELAMIGRMFSQGAALYADILTSNPDGVRVCHLFEQESAHFSRAVAMSDRAAVVSRFQQIADFMTDFATWARKESDAILHDLVRHG